MFRRYMVPLTMVANITKPMIITGAIQLLETGASKLYFIIVEINEIQFE